MVVIYTAIVKMIRPTAALLLLLLLLLILLHHVLPPLPMCLGTLWRHFGKMIFNILMCRNYCLTCFIIFVQLEHPWIHMFKCACGSTVMWTSSNRIQCQWMKQLITSVHYELWEHAASVYLCTNTSPMLEASCCLQHIRLQHFMKITLFLVGFTIPVNDLVPLQWKGFLNTPVNLSAFFTNQLAEWGEWLSLGVSHKGN